MTPEEKYRTDATYRRSVDSIEKLLRDRNCSLSEISEMAGLASVHFEFGKDFVWTSEEILRREA